ncbi:ATP-dependent DNA helicase [Trichonephila clavata]|uniref:ATP-dependent DNA helicase n=1 Tax=Trichonephila clavata TaxID=2740835 RepID=A0A8X6IHM9_TRICU|nr:ATP-dependent DNA helicase [Trichonephila clavata]
MSLVKRFRVMDRFGNDERSEQRHILLKDLLRRIDVTQKFIWDAARKYIQSHPEAYRDDVRIYTQSQPKFNKDAAQKYTQSHLEVKREAVRKFAQRHPEVNRKTVKNYVSKNSHVARTKNNKCKEKIYEIRLFPWTSKHLFAFKYIPNVDYSMDGIENLGPRLPCSWCHALQWKNEIQGMCCSAGKVQLTNLEPFPEPLHTLLTHQDPLLEHFLSTVRKYNGCFQIRSFGAKEINESNFMPTFKLRERVYHRIGSLMTRVLQKPSFLQIYFMGAEHHKKDIRCGIYPRIKPELIKQLQKSMHEHNKYIMGFKAAIDSVPKDQKEFKVVINAERRKPFGDLKGI